MLQKEFIEIGNGSIPNEDDGGGGDGGRQPTILSVWEWNVYNESNWVQTSIWKVNRFNRQLSNKMNNGIVLQVPHMYGCVCVCVWFVTKLPHKTTT